MMDSGPVRNMESTLSNKFEKLCISLAFIIRIYHDARSSECQIQNECYNKIVLFKHVNCKMNETRIGLKFFVTVFQDFVKI
jgi:hypothetical protein